MAHYRMEENPDRVAIHLSDASGHEQELLEALRECQSGVDEYR
jgi:hypothetical protein